MQRSWQLSAPDVEILNVFTAGGQKFVILKCNYCLIEGEFFQWHDWECQLQDGSCYTKFY